MSITCFVLVSLKFHPNNFLIPCLINFYLICPVKLKFYIFSIHGYMYMLYRYLKARIQVNFFAQISCPAYTVFVSAQSDCVVPCLEHLILVFCSSSNPPIECSLVEIVQKILESNFPTLGWHICSVINQERDKQLL